MCNLIILLPRNLFDVVEAAVTGIDVELIDITDLETDELLVLYNKHFFLSGDMGGGSNNADFNKLTSARLFYLHAWMVMTSAEHVLHLENDNLIYFDFAEWIHNISDCGMKIAMTCRQMTPDARFMVAGVVYIRNSRFLSDVLTHSVELLKLGKDKVVQLMGTKWINDMSLFGYFYWHHMTVGHPPGHYTPPTTLSILPEGGEDGLGSDDPTSHEDLIRQCVWEKAPLLFDNAAIGIWNFGDFHEKAPKTHPNAWGAYERIPANVIDDFKWNENNSKRFPTWNGARVASIHMHSKIMGPALSHDIVQGKLRKGSFPFITGDGFRTFCRKRCEQIIQGKATCNFHAKDVKSGDCIFIATTDLLSFRTTSAFLHAFSDVRKGIKYPYFVVTHNGDLSSPDGDSWHQNETNPEEWKETFSAWLDDPLLTRYFASNCNWNTPKKPDKLSCIPIGLENEYVPNARRVNINGEHEDRKLFRTSSCFESGDHITNTLNHRVFRKKEGFFIEIGTGEVESSPRTKCSQDKLNWTGIFVDSTSKRADCQGKGVVSFCQEDNKAGERNMSDTFSIATPSIVDLLSFSSADAAVDVDIISEMTTRPRYVVTPTLIHNERKMEVLGYVAEPTIFNRRYQKDYTSTSKGIWRDVNYKLVLIAFERDDKWKPDRGEALDSLRGKPFILHAEGNLERDVWERLVRSHDFVVCPHGHGWDTHRLWEVLLLGSTPIVKSSPLDELFRDLPVVILADWGDLTVQRLREWQESVVSSNGISAAMYPYWHKKLLDAKKQAVELSAQFYERKAPK